MSKAKRSKANSRRRRASIPSPADTATPERLAKAGTDVEVAEVGGGQMVLDWPLQRLYRAGAFGPVQDTIARKRLAAGEELYRHWYHGRLLKLGSRDYRQPYSAGSGFAVWATTDRQVDHREKWRAANRALGSDRIANVTRAIVIDEKEPAAVGKAVTGRTHEQQARAVAIEYLIDGLDRLRAFWGLRD